jgi:hypothetical protein
MGGENTSYQSLQNGMECAIPQEAGIQDRFRYQATPLNLFLN